MIGDGGWIELDCWGRNGVGRNWKRICQTGLNLHVIAAKGIAEEAMEYRGV